VSFSREHGLSPEKLPQKSRQKRMVSPVHPAAGLRPPGAGSGAGQVAGRERFPPVPYREAKLKSITTNTAVLPGFRFYFEMVLAVLEYATALIVIPDLLDFQAASRHAGGAF
jgi:hypothetical protein